MKIELSKIKPSPRPVRTSWDEDKMSELAASIKEQGLIVPIKVRPIPIEDGDSAYEIVYGHRRAHASRLAGLTDIEAIVEAVDDANALIQALLENVMREDLSSMDKARGLKALKEGTGWSAYKMEQRGIMSAARIGQLLELTSESLTVQEMLNSKTILLSESLVRAVRSVGLPKEEHIATIQEAAKEGWTAHEAQRVAKAVKKGLDDIAKETVAKHLADEEAQKERVFWETHVGGMADEMRRAIATSRREFERCMARVRKFPTAMPAEHIPYIESRVRKQGEYLIGLADELDAKRIKEIASG